MPQPTIEWIGACDGFVRIIDQTRLPNEYVTLEITSPVEMFAAIKRLSIRGAPAIGIAGAYGLVLAVGKTCLDSEEALFVVLEEAADYLKSSRPTAVNLFWAIDRAMSAARTTGGEGVDAVRSALFEEARAIHEEDMAVCRKIGQVGQQIMPDPARVLTHCNAGALATADYGTALAVIYRANELGKRVSVMADETRPLLQGSRLTAWELMNAGIDVKVICDNTAAAVLKAGMVDLVITGADRIAANGDAANKVGTLGVAVLAHEFGVPFYVAAPVSTFDMSISEGDLIPIEERPPEEVTEGFSVRTAPAGVGVFCPAFDVTPARYISAIITERGLISRPDVASVAQVVDG